MNWQDTGYLLTKNKYSENSAIVEFFTKKRGKVSGIIYGATSKKLKNYLLIGNKFHINYITKSENKLGYFNIEIDKINTPIYLENQRKLSCICYSMNLIKILTVENQENLNLYILIDELFDFLKNEIWINTFILWELNIFNKLGYSLNFEDYVIKATKNNKDVFYLKSDTTRIIPSLLIKKNIISTDEVELLDALKIVGDFLDKSILGPNNINPIMTRGVFINSIKKDL
tara:strand:+ start:1169 stop:1855 length:687 start_codon:yes stop_codon:yes gene_type:complete